jgi:mono/diheme cytochrome c family protein
MLSHRMKWTPRRLLALPALAAAVTAVAACGESGIKLASSDPNYQGAVLFDQHCSGCHTLETAGTQGSASNVRTREYKDGPNFNARKEQKKQVASFVAKYSGQDAARPVTPPTGTPQGFNGNAPEGKTGGGQSSQGEQGTQTGP